MSSRWFTEDPYTRCHKDANRGSPVKQQKYSKADPYHVSKCQSDEIVNGKYMWHSIYINMKWARFCTDSIVLVSHYSYTEAAHAYDRTRTDKQTNRQRVTVWLQLRQSNAVAKHHLRRAYAYMRYCERMCLYHHRRGTSQEKKHAFGSIFLCDQDYVQCA